MRICDVCNQPNATWNIKVFAGSPKTDMKWADVDICDQCAPQVRASMMSLLTAPKNEAVPTEQV